MNNVKRIKILSIFEKNNPFPRTELFFSSPFELLIAVILSAQTTDKIVNKCTKDLYRVASTPKKILSLGEEKIRFYIKRVNFYKKKASYIFNTSYLLIHEFKQIIPRNRKQLESLPGMGRKSANILLNELFDKYTVAVDRHVFRVCNRINFVKSSTVIGIEKKILRVTPKKFKKNFHNWLVLHGRYVCKKRKPLCKSCIINKFCEFKKKII